MSKDKSREKSLLFLLSTVSRTLETLPENKIKIRESITTLDIQDSGENWKVTVELPNQNIKSVEINKARFSFYPVKSAARYDTNPAILNKNSAQEVLLVLFDEFGVQVPGMKPLSTERSIRDFVPVNLLLASLFTIFSTYNFEFISAILIVLHLVVSTSKHHKSTIRRWILIAGVSIPALCLLALNDSIDGNILLTISQTTLLLVFDILIRLETFRVSKFTIAVARGTAFLIAILILNVSATNLLSISMMAVIVTLGYVLLKVDGSSPLLNLLFLLQLGLMILLVCTLLISDPIKLLLLPYLIYISIYEIFFGSNRNPGKLAFGVVCL